MQTNGGMTEADQGITEGMNDGEGKPMVETDQILFPYPGGCARETPTVCPNRFRRSLKEMP